MVRATREVYRLNRLILIVALRTFSYCSRHLARMICKRFISVKTTIEKLGLICKIGCVRIHQLCFEN
jgi:hypothetical protein